jgi:hypothetical protein
MARLQDGHGLSVPIRDPETGQVVAVLARPEAFPPPPAPRLGGMATPLGVYLTDGVVSGGAGFWGLFLTGLTLSVLALISEEAVRGLISLGAAHGFDLLGWAASPRLDPALRALLTEALEWLPAPLIFILLRLIPMSGTHAAEHQAVHCVEKNLPLTLDSVRMQPRVHPRCGTNIFVAFSLYLLIFVAVFSAAYASQQDIGDAATMALIAAAVPTALLWRRIGGWIQYWLATRPATDLQIAGAIRAAEEVLRRRRTVSRPLRFRPLRRIWRMGLAQVLLAYLALYGPLLFAAEHWASFGNWLGI